MFLHLSEGGPIPLLESLSCGVNPVVTQTGFAFDVLGKDSPDQILPAGSPFQEFVSSILSVYNNPSNTTKNRALAAPYTFDAAAVRIFDLLRQV